MKRQSNIIFMSPKELQEGLKVIEGVDRGRYKNILCNPTNFPYLMCKTSGGYTQPNWNSKEAITDIQSAELWEDVKEAYCIAPEDTRKFTLCPKFNDLLINNKPEYITNHDRYIEIYCKQFGISTEVLQKTRVYVYSWRTIDLTSPQSVKNLAMIIRDSILSQYSRVPKD